MNKPNIFNWAVSELSKDVFICWLLSWANYPEYETLYNTARYCIKMMTDGRIQDFDKVAVMKEMYHADVICLIDDQAAIIIDDTIGATEQANRLAQCKEQIAADNDNLEFFLVYYKIGDKSDYGEIEKQGYMKCLREQILDILHFGIAQGVNHPIFTDYLEYLSKIELSYQLIRHDGMQSKDAFSMCLENYRGH